jgi:tetratricopeptide (TPR) repeat protein
MRNALAVALLVLAAGCAARTPPPLPAALRYAEFLYPVVPAALKQTPGADRVDAGWRYLQNDDLRSAEQEFAAALKRTPALYPAQAGTGYVLLARRDYARAADAFAAALRASPQYVPALVGRGQTLLALERDADALVAFEAALAEDASLADVRRRVELLQFRNVQDTIAAARSAAAAGRRGEARTAYTRAIAATPDSAFLHRELGVVERQDGNAAAALTHFQKAVELDPADTVSLVQTGELLEQRQDYAGAEASYRRAAAVEPSAALSARIAAVAEKGRDARLPAPFRELPAASAITRGDLAALIGVRLESLISSVPPRQVVLTDVTGHWAAPWITAVAQAGVMEPFENHTFQPRARLRRAELAAAVSRVVALISPDRPALRARLAERPRISDMTTGHLSYPAASIAVAAGVIPLLDGDRFQVGREVSGAEAVEAVDRLRALIASR